MNYKKIIRLAVASGLAMLTPGSVGSAPLLTLGQYFFLSTSADCLPGINVSDCTLSIKSFSNNMFSTIERVSCRVRSPVELVRIEVQPQSYVAANVLSFVYISIPTPQRFDEDNSKNVFQYLINDDFLLKVGKGDTVNFYLKFKQVLPDNFTFARCSVAGQLSSS